MILFVSLNTKVFHFHEVEKYPMICVTSTKRRLMQKETGNCEKTFFFKSRNNCDILFPEKLENVTPVNFIFHKMERYSVI